MEPLTESGLVAEVATGAFSFKNKISLSSVRALWDKLARFVADALKQQKGVLLPNLGTFTVGPVVGEARKKVRPAFTLLETRYSGVSQERPKYTIGGRCPVVQPNYGLLATASAVHRGTCQRLLLELMQRLGVHILSGRPVLVVFPGVGRLFTNRAGRVQFEFEPLLREFFELERERVIPEMERGGPGGEGEEAENVVNVVKGLQHVHLHNPPAIRSRPVSGAAAASPSARVKRNVHAPYKGELLGLWRLCKTNDRITSGCVPRLQLEQWLHTECPQVLRRVAAAKVMGLLSIHTYGKTGKHILYKPFLDQLEAAVEKEEHSPQRVNSPQRVVEIRIDSPAAAIRRRKMQQQLEAATADGDDGGGEEGIEEASEVTPSPVRRGQSPQQGQPHAFWQHHPAPGQHANLQEPYQHQPQPYPQLYQPQGQHPAPQYQVNPQWQFPPYTPQGQPNTPQADAYYPPPQQQHGQSYPQQQQQQQHGQSYPQQQQLQQGHPQFPAKPHQPGSGQRPPHTPHVQVAAWAGQQQAPGPDALDAKPYHYYQNQLSPRSRREFDDFNRLHFEKLEQVRGAGYKQRAVTPKVGEDELNRQEYHAVRQGMDGITPAQVLRLQEDPPYSRDAPHPITSSQRRRGSPGPRPQILTLAHEQPPPQPSYSPVPGLPNHQYQRFQQQPYAVRQPVPQHRPQSARQPTPQSQSLPAEQSPPISQYEVMNEPDPAKRRMKRHELANALNRNWSEQIREKEAVLEDLAEAQAQWPYVPTHRPNDKRPADAVSRPVSAWGP